MQSPFVLAEISLTEISTETSTLKCGFKKLKVCMEISGQLWTKSKTFSFLNIKFETQVDQQNSQ
jgi:hypothetical protein